jgi:protocatechuate 3,4-dioxygenase beta subunit
MALVFWGAATLGAQSRSVLEIVVHDGENRPVPAVRLEVKRADALVTTAQTDTAGHAAFPGLPPAQYEVTAAKEGFETLRHGGIELAGADAGPA